MTWIAIRADASVDIGLGHIMRCLALAEALNKRGIQCVFFSRSIHPDIAGRIIKQGGQSVQLESLTPADIIDEGTPTAHAQWLEVSQAQDAQDFLHAVDQHSFERKTPPMGVIIDHYALDHRWQQTVSAHLNIPLAVIDDLSDRRHACDILIDQTAGKVAQDYDALVPPHCNKLVGAEYTWLRSEFPRSRIQSLNRRDTQSNKAPGQANKAPGQANKAPWQVLIAMGGVDQHNDTGNILALLNDSKLPNDTTIHILIGGLYPHQQALQITMQNSRYKTKLHSNISTVSALLSDIDLCIGAAGSSSWERCCLGVPTLSVITADNQRQVDKQLNNIGATLSLGQAKDLTHNGHLQAAIQTLCNNPNTLNTMSQKARTVCDGWGTSRFIRAFFLPSSSNDQAVTLRPFKASDAELLYDWQCFPNTRKYAVHPEIPKLQDHLAWVDRRLARMDAFYMGICNGIPVGMVRLDPYESHPDDPRQIDMTHAKEVSILTAPEAYGMGVGTALLKQLADKHQQTSIVAHVLPLNIASQKLFHKAGYKPLRDEHFILMGSPQSDASLVQ